MALLNSGPDFFKHMNYLEKLLLTCSNEYFVSQQDKKEIRKGDADMQRTHVYYLMQADKELRDLQTNPKTNPGKVKIFMDMIDFSFGLIHRNNDQIAYLDKQIRDYIEYQSEAIFILFVGVVNHWIALVAHKREYRLLDDKEKRDMMAGRKRLTKFYLLDSSNI